MKSLCLGDPDSPVAVTRLGGPVHRDTVCQIGCSFQTPDGDAGWSNHLRIGSVVVAALTRIQRGVVSEVELTPEADGVPTVSFVNLDNLHTRPRGSFRRRVATLGATRLAETCRALRGATDC